MVDSEGAYVTIRAPATTASHGVAGRKALREDMIVGRAEENGKALGRLEERGRGHQRVA